MYTQIVHLPDMSTDMFEADSELDSVTVYIMACFWYM